MTRFICICFFIFFVFQSYAQKFISKNQYSVESALLISTSKVNPFFLRTIKNGEVPFNSNFGSIRLEAKHEYDSTYTADRKLEKFSYGYGLRTAMNIGKSSNAVLTEAYAKVRYGVFEIYAGRRREIVGLVDTIMTSGSFIWSGNALPIPKIQISIPNYTPILKNGLIAIKGTYAHGWMGDGDSVKNVWLHQKTFYMRVGKPAWRFRFFGGFNHQVQWGGKPTKAYYEAATNQVISKYDTDFNTYLDVVTGLSLNRNSDGLTTGAPANEALNRAGNHLGSVDIGFEYTGKLNNILMYRQSFYEDGSLYYLNNIKDGLYGISLTRKNVNVGITKICFEYLYTKNQGGEGTYKSTIPQLRGNDSYFNNGVYKDNWIYRNNIIGTNYFQTLNNQINPINTLFYSPNFIGINKVEMVYLSCQIKLNDYEINSKMSYSNQESMFFNLTYKNQFSLYESIQKSYNKLQIKLGLAYDYGMVLKNSLGTNINLKYIIQ
jgi:hypothetical protein